MIDEDPQLQELVAKQAIHECIMRYCRGSDRFDADLIRSTFHHDGVVERERTFTREEWVELSMARDRARARSHHVDNVLIEVDGETAIGETSWIAYQVWSDGGVRYVRTRAARYVDRFVRRAGEWRVVYRGVVDDWSFTQEVGAQIDQGRSALVGRDFPDDPIYLISRGSTAVESAR